MHHEPKRVNHRTEERMNQKPSGQRSAETRERLRSAATTAFAARGFHGTSTRDIAAEAGMSPAALYVHYSSKEELLHEISREGHVRTLTLIEQAAASAGSATDQLDAVIRHFTADHARTATTARIVNYELSSLSPEHLEDVLDLRRRISAALRNLIARGIEAGEFETSDPEMAATALLSLGIDVARWYRPDGKWSPDELGAFYADLARRAVGAAASPAS
jgi:AcrR family transcriptional regulator